MSDSTAAAFSPLVGYDGSDIVIWIVAVFLVAVGAYWAQQPRKRSALVEVTDVCKLARPFKDSHTVALMTCFTIIIITLLLCHDCGS